MNDRNGPIVSTSKVIQRSNNSFAATDSKKQMLTYLAEAKDALEPKPGAPKFLRWLFRRQQPFNQVLLSAIKYLSAAAERVEQQLNESRKTAAEHGAEINSAHVKVDALAKSQEEDRLLASTLQLQLDQLQQVVQQRVVVDDDLQGQVGRLGAHMLNLQKHADLVAEANRKLSEQLGTTSSDLQAQISRLGNHLTQLSESDTKLGEQLAEMGGRIAQLSDVSANSQQQIASITNDLSQLGFTDSNLQEQIATLGQHLTQLSADNARFQEQLIDLSRDHTQLAATHSDLQEQIARLGDHLNHLSADDTSLHEQLVSLSRDLRQLNNVDSDLQEQIARLGGHFNQLSADDASFQTQLANLSKDHSQLGVTDADLQEQIARLGGHLTQLGSTDNDLQEQIGRIGFHVNQLSATDSDLQEQIARLNSETGALRSLLDAQTSFSEAISLWQESYGSRLTDATQRLSRLEGVSRNLSQLEETVSSDNAFFKSEISRLVQLAQRKAFAVRTGGKEVVNKAASDPAFDAFYVRFEDQFRGSRREIKSRVEFYLPHIKACKAGSKSRPILDVGCGRGEWLELLKENKLVASGVDLNDAMVAQCREQKLAVTHEDVITYLRRQPSASHGAVTGFHIIEHLPVEVLLSLLRETARVLLPGGVAIFESPNCKNLIVGASNFNIDPTHRNPVYPETAQFMLSLQGFHPVELHFLSPMTNAPASLENAENAALKELLYGPQDFCAIAHKPSRTRVRSRSPGKLA